MRIIIINHSKDIYNKDGKKGLNRYNLTRLSYLRNISLVVIFLVRIYNANYHHQSLKGSTMYIVGLPVCHECAKGIIQAGVTRVVAQIENVPLKWSKSDSITEKMFKEAGVIYEKTRV